MGANYIMENPDEAQRLELKTDASVVESYARRAGLGPGMRVADIACGAGVTTSVLGAVVGPAGRALGIDASEGRMARARQRFGGGNVEFAVKDILAPMEGLGSFDFAWIRFALEYYKAESFDIARNAAALLDSGGILCLVDLDYNCLSHYAMPPRLEAALAAAVRQLEAKGNFDPYAGRKLYSHLYRLGFRDIGVEVGAHHVIYGALGPTDEYNWGKKIEVLSRNLDIELPGYSGPGEFYEDFMRFFRDPARFTYTPVIAAWGVKPG